jgi:hypothetical protein
MALKKMNLEKITADLKNKYPDIGIRSIETSGDGKATFYLDPTQKSLAFLGKKDGTTPHSEAASTIRRDALDRGTLDLIKKDPFTEPYNESIKRAIKYYYTEPLVGSTLNLLASLSAKGFENDVDDPDIKNFYDTWVFDTNFAEVIEWIFLDFFKVGNVYTYKAVQKYEPRVSYLSTNPGKKVKKPGAAAAQEFAAKKNVWSKGFLPVSYTVLNPELVKVDGNLLFDKTSITLTPPTELKDLLKKSGSDLSEDEKLLIKSLPSELKKAVTDGKDFKLESNLVGRITYRKQPYERYAKPRSTRIFDSIEYYKSLRNADLSTLDGISNYIIKVTIGNDEYPVTTQDELEAVSQLFNTPSKSFSVVWNHTLQVEKIVSPEIASILGKEKYAQVNDDISGGLGISRALIDGMGNANAAQISLMVKGVMEEINYARRQVERWIYNEYRQIAEAMGFTMFPKIRWDEGVLKDSILYMSTLSQLVDRRMLSYNTALESLGFDYPTELQNMKTELPLVEEGIFGLAGSPFQQAKAGPGVQPVQKAPTGTPSSGRPKGQVPKTKQPVTDTNKKVKNPPKAESSENFAWAKEMTDEEYEVFISELERVRGEE